jgi:hypothetical protein
VPIAAETGAAERSIRVAQIQAKAQAEATARAQAAQKAYERRLRRQAFWQGLENLGRALQESSRPAPAPVMVMPALPQTCTTFFTPSPIVQTTCR